jgi:hypothetical protein
VDLYLFDFDKTLYANDFHFRLPTPSPLTGASLDHLAKTRWSGGYEERAEGGEWPSSDQYLEGASAPGINTHQLRYVNALPQTDALDDAITRSSGRSA